MRAAIHKQSHTIGARLAGKCDCVKGAKCSGVREAKTFSGFCEFASEGQLVVSNPTTFGLGSSASVTVKVTKIARSSSPAQ